MNQSTEILTVNDANQAPCPETCNTKNPKQQQILVGWNRSKSYFFIGIMVCLVAWAAIFFPLKKSYDL